MAKSVDQSRLAPHLLELPPAIRLLLRLMLASFSGEPAYVRPGLTTLLLMAEEPEAVVALAQQHHWARTSQRNLPNPSLCRCRRPSRPSISKTL